MCISRYLTLFIRIYKSLSRTLISIHDDFKTASEHVSCINYCKVHLYAKKFVNSERSIGVKVVRYVSGAGELLGEFPVLSL